MRELPAVPRALPLLVDDGVALALRGGWESYWWVAAPLAALSAVASSLGVRWSRALGGSEEQLWLEGCGSLLLLVMLVPIGLVAALYAYTALHAAAAQRICLDRRSAALALRFAVRPGTVATMMLVLLAVALTAALTFLLLFVPALLVAGLFGLVVPVMVAEGLAGPDALGRSARLLWHNPDGRFLGRPLFQVLAILLLYGLVANALTLMVSLPYQLLSQAVLFRRLLGGEIADPASALGALLWLQVPTQIVASLVHTWVVYYVGVCLALFYRDLRARRQGDDLERRLERLIGGSAQEA